MFCVEPPESAQEFIFISVVKHGVHIEASPGLRKLMESCKEKQSRAILRKALKHFSRRCIIIANVFVFYRNFFLLTEDEAAELSNNEHKYTFSSFPKFLLVGFQRATVTAVFICNMTEKSEISLHNTKLRTKTLRGAE